MLGFFNGKSSVAKVYWLGFALSGVVFNGLYKYINYLYLTETGPAWDRAETAHNLLLIFNVLWVGVLLRALIKSAYNGRTPGGWGWIAICLVSVNFAYTSFVTFTVLLPGTYNPLFLLQAEIRELNKQLPQRMDSETVMTRVAVEDKNLKYFITAEFEADDLMQDHLDWEFSNESPGGQDLCDLLEGSFSGGLKEVVYVFKYTNKTLSAGLTAEECNAYFATLRN